MPIYEYKSAEPESKDSSCYMCREPFELRRSLDRAQELKCPLCKNPLVKLVSKVSHTKKEGFSASEAKAAGFTLLNNLGDGVVEKE